MLDNRPNKKTNDIESQMRREVDGDGEEGEDGEDGKNEEGQTSGFSKGKNGMKSMLS